MGVLEDTGRVGFNAIKEKIFEKEIKKGHSFGPSWTTHWVKVEFTIPEEWLEEEKEVHLIWHTGCEGGLYSETGKLVYSFSDKMAEFTRNDYIIKKKGFKNDFDDPKVNPS